MNIEIFARDEDFFIRLPGSTMALRWFCEEGSWGKAKEKLPDVSNEVIYRERHTVQNIGGVKVDKYEKGVVISSDEAKALGDSVTAHGGPLRDDK